MFYIILVSSIDIRLETIRMKTSWNLFVSNSKSSRMPILENLFIFFYFFVLARACNMNEYLILMFLLVFMHAIKFISSFCSGCVIWNNIFPWFIAEYIKSHEFLKSYIEHSKAESEREKMSKFLGSRDPKEKW